MQNSNASGKARSLLAPAWRSLRASYLDAKASLLLALGHDRVALASYPRSGNTWMRALLEAATGEQTGSIYRDVVMPRGTEGIATKTHALDRHRYTQALHIVRDPADVAMSHFYWLRDIAGRPRSLEDVVTTTASNWPVHTEHWLEFVGPKMTLRFEDLRSDPVASLRRVLGFLECPTEDARISDAVEETKLERLRKRTGGDTGEHFFRNGKSGEGRRALEPTQLHTLAEATGALRSRLGYEPLEPAV